MNDWVVYLCLTVIVAGALLAMGCTSTRLMGQFTVASTHNVRNLRYSMASNTKVRTEGETCIRSFLGIEWGDTDDRLQRAMDDAIREGQDQGIDGDILANVRIQSESFSLIIYGSNCMTVSGDLVKIEP